MRFQAPDGHREVLWVERNSDDAYRVLNVPVWLYGISVGTIVRGREGDEWLEYHGTVAPSPGATVRIYLPDGAALAPASRVYLERIFPDCSKSRLLIGPATFFDPLVVAIHLRNRDDWDGAAAAYFDQLIVEGVAMLWEIGDPDMYPSEEPDVEELSEELVHPRPSSER
jgi:hypothetical protein